MTALLMAGLSSQAAATIVVLKESHLDTFNYRPVWACTYEAPDNKRFTIYIPQDKGPCPVTYELR